MMRTTTAAFSAREGGARRSCFAAVVVAIGMGAIVTAQSTDSRRAPAFEVASIKKNASGAPASFALRLLPGGRVFAQNVPLRDVIRSAYGLEDDQLEGGPSWLKSDRFDLEARGPADVTADTARAMVRTLLTDRLSLVVHTESRQLPIYALVLARSNGTLGPSLRRAGSACAPVTVPSGMPPPPPPPSGLGTALGVGVFGCPSGLLPGYFSLRSLDIAAFASVLWRRVLMKPVIDKTALTGTFDVDLSYLPENERFNGTPAIENPLLPPSTSTAPSIFTAVQEQLGLKLESTRGPVDVLVVDRAERPSDN